MGKPYKSFLKRSQTGHPPTFPPLLNRWLSAIIIATMMAISTVVVAAELPPTSSQANRSNPSHSNSIQISQRIRRKNIWQEVQKQLPDLPQENHYISNLTGKISESNTLVRRMIEYHNFRKGRSPRSRFDWKLTLADYLDIHEVILADNYPGTRKLKTNPITGDKAAIQALDRQQRQQLVNTIVSLYDPRIPAAFFDPATPTELAPAQEPGEPTPPTIEAAPTRPTPPPLAEPGAADLLRPRTELTPAP